MLSEFLREIVVSIVGKGSEPIADLLHSNRYVNEFTIAKKLEITINQTRNILYKISDYGLVASERQKDKKKGWYTYYWKFEILKCLEHLKGNLLKRREQFQTQIDRREEKQYYVCEYCNIECSEDEALLQEFTCDECGELFTTKDNSALLKGLKKNMEKIDEKIAIIDIEIAKEVKKIMRKRALSVKREEEEKLAKKEEAKRKRAEKRALRDKELEAQGLLPKKKKVVKKKVAKKKVAKKKVAKKKVAKKKVAKKKVAKKKVAKKKVAKKKVPKKVAKAKTLKRVVKSVMKKAAKKTAAKKKK